MWAAVIKAMIGVNTSVAYETFPVLRKGRQVPHLRRSVLFWMHTQAFRPGLTFGGPALRA